MGSPPAPHLANGWLSQYGPIIKGNSQLFTRYMDDVLQEMNRNEIADKLTQIKNLHPNLTFTIERKTNRTIPFLDMQIRNTGGVLSPTWYSKPTDTAWFWISMHWRLAVTRNLWFQVLCIELSEHAATGWTSTTAWGRPKKFLSKTSACQSFTTLLLNRH